MLAVFALSLLVLAGCAEEPDTGGGGIEGIATQGPTCAGPEHNPPQAGCEDKPYVGSLEVRASPSAEVVKTFDTGPDGSFRVALAPGRYIVGTPAARATPPTCGSDPFTVLGDTITVVAVACDTGIR